MPQAPLTAEPGDKIAVIQTNKGTIKVKLYTKDMPISTKNFIDLIERKFYDGLTFHRVEDWVVQGGDPTATGTGGSGKTIKLEINKKNGFKKPGMIGMARTNVPDSATSQFFFNTKPAEFLDSGYACFGGVVDGMEVLYKLKVGDKMTKVTLEDYKPAAKANGVDAPPPPPPAPSVN